MRKTYLVCYDICDDRRLAKVHKIVRGFGDRIQYSVFECQLTAADLARCRHRLGEIIDHRLDQVIFVDLGPVDGRGDRVITAIGKAYSPIDAPCIIVDGLREGRRGRPHCDAGPEAWPADRVQVCVQALILREHDYAVSYAVVYYYETKQRVRVPIDDDLVAETTTALAAARAIAEAGRIPAPLVDSPKCPRCSLVAICLPDETRRAMALEPAADTIQLSLLEHETTDDDRRPLNPEDEEPAVRRLVPARDDLRPLYVTGYALTVGKRDERLQVKEKGQLVQDVRLHDISQVNVFGAVTVTGPALQALCWAEKPVAHFTYGGWFAGMTTGLGLKNVFLRIEQVRRADDERFCRRIAREVVASKIRNQRTLLQRNHVEPSRLALARLYFEQFAGMLKPEDGDELPPFHFEHRNRRPPRDPINALLSFVYSLLAKDLTIVCHAVGFDPFVGFYHQPRFGRPALALDLMEGFRPLVADSAVLSAVNTRMVTPKDFIQAGHSVGLSPAGRKGLLRAYEQRMDHLVTHPLFGYRVNYRRVLEIQARLLARVVTASCRDIRASRLGECGIRRERCGDARMWAAARGA